MAARAEIRVGQRDGNLVHAHADLLLIMKITLSLQIST